MIKIDLVSGEEGETGSQEASLPQVALGCGLSRFLVNTTIVSPGWAGLGAAQGFWVGV